MAQLKHRYKVYARCVTYCHVFVSAYDEDDAIETANDIDGGQFVIDDQGDWEMVEVEKCDMNDFEP